MQYILCLAFSYTTSAETDQLVQDKKYCVRVFDFTCVPLAKAGLVMGPLRPSVGLSIRNTFGVPSLCNL